MGWVWAKGRIFLSKESVLFLAFVYLFVVSVTLITHLSWLVGIAQVGEDKSIAIWCHRRGGWRFTRGLWTN